jgi:hypothetical protein
VTDRVDGNIVDLDLVGRGSDRGGELFIDALDLE